MYCKDLESGLCDGTATPRIVKETTSTALVDGQNGIGPVSIDKYITDSIHIYIDDEGCG